MAAMLTWKRRCLVFFALFPLVSATNTTINEEEDPEISWDDATWILTSAFIIFTMQSGE